MKKILLYLSLGGLALFSISFTLFNFDKITIFETNNGEQYTANANGAGSTAIGKIELNGPATYNVIDKKIESTGNSGPYRAIITASSTEGTIPNSVCVTVSTDVEVTDLQMDGSGVQNRTGDRQSKMCWSNPPSKFVLTYTLSGNPNSFEVTEIK